MKRFPLSPQAARTALACAAVLIAAALLLGYAGRSFSLQPSHTITCTSPRAQYPLTEEVIEITAVNLGEDSGEFPHPRLDVLRHGRWHTLDHPTENETAELLSLQAGETKTFCLYLSPYRPQLREGHYRAFFGLPERQEYFALEFDLTGF